MARALLADRERVLGPDHPHTLTTRNNIAYWTGQAVNTVESAATATRMLSITRRPSVASLSQLAQ